MALGHHPDSTSDIIKVLKDEESTQEKKTRKKGRIKVKIPYRLSSAKKEGMKNNYLCEFTKKSGWYIQLNDT